MKRVASRIVLLCVIYASCANAERPRPATPSVGPMTEAGHRPDRRYLRFAHLTTNDGLSQGYVTAILQDRRGFMWFATRDGLNRYDGNAFAIYKNNPADPGSLSANFIQDLLEDAHGYLWIATNNGVNRFDPKTERFTQYLHDPANPNSLSGAYVVSIAQDRQGYLWFGTEASGLDRLDPATGLFTHYRNDSDRQFVGRITQVIEDRQRDIWFVGDRGLFQLNQQTGQLRRRSPAGNGLRADSLYEDETGSLWMLTLSPVAGLIKYDPRTGGLAKYPLSTAAEGVLASGMNGGSLNGRLLADGQDGMWLPSSQGLYYFDRRTERFSYRFEHDESNPDSLDSNAIMSLYRDRGGVLWVGTENDGLNILNFRQEQFRHYMHRRPDPNSLSPGRVKAIYEDYNGILWVGLYPRALNRLDRKTGKVTRYLPGGPGENGLGAGTNINALYKDAAGHLWIGGGGSGVVRFDERTGRFRHYRHIPGDPGSLLSDNVITIFGDRAGGMWIGGQSGLSHFDPATERFDNYQPVPDNPASLMNWIWTIHQDRSGTIRIGTFGGALARFDDKSKTFVSYPPDSHDPKRLNGGGITSIHEDRSGTLWVGGFDGLYRFNRQNETFSRYTEREGLPSSTIRCIQEDASGRLWLSTQRGVARFDILGKTFRNYDVYDGLQSNEFSDGCFQGAGGEIFFGGSNGFNAFFPENVEDNAYVPPIVITSFKTFNKPVAIGAESVLKKATAYVDSLTLPHQDNVFSFEFAALSYANSNKNRYRYKLENFDTGWNEVGAKQRLATYTNLDPGKYVFRVQGSNSDGAWNREGVALPILITPPWWRTNWFQSLSGAVFVALLCGAYQLRLRRLQYVFQMRLQGRVEERTRVARELHDTLLQSFQASLIRMQAARNMFDRHPETGLLSLDTAIRTAADAISEGRGAIQNLRGQPTTGRDLAQLLTAAGQELAQSETAQQKIPMFRMTVEGAPKDLKPLLQDEVYRVVRELLRNAFQHAHASRIEVEIRYETKQLRMHVRDDGKGIDPEILKAGGRVGHWGLPGMRERVSRFGGRLEFWSNAGAGTEALLTVPAAVAYGASDAGPLSVFRRNKAAP